MADNNWRNNPLLSDISSKKLDYLEKISSDINKLGQKERVPFILAAIQKMKSDDVALSKDETLKILSVIQKNV